MMPLQVRCSIVWSGNSLKDVFSNNNVLGNFMTWPSILFLDLSALLDISDNSTL